MEFLVEVRGSLDLKCLAFPVRPFCRAVLEAVVNTAVCAYLPDPLRQSSSLRNLVRMDQIMANRCLLICPQSFQVELQV